ncbi:threonine-phosphate decarboxylase CobD [Pseudomonas sp. NW5]|uniref:threonine-phosphate decarboxylase CobD n=1 Tax=Pseudomonas sp. NW5 TaxID=2934934 RepID=UPI002020CC0A|nr:threonine-phosphate decarboxylase CobD [Pseudomonas sp. NW5]MCL7462518.1 threonine-phosphate decarboxylase CobD [Pseudomonas sp. NW5]
MLEHGGRLKAAARHYGIAEADWLDLSTGIAPIPWPLPPLPESAWARLPEEGDALAALAARCYGAQHALPVAGSQAAIQALPLLWPRARVAVLTPCYAEHAAAWQRAGHALQPVSAEAIEAQLEQQDVLVLANPNNPTGMRFSADQLLAWHARLAARGGLLLVDEAFMDCSAAQSIAAHAHQPGLVVLRSFGKFFGLAGVRLGFVLAEPALLARLQQHLGPWTVSGPARLIGCAALAPDAAAARASRAAQLEADGARLAALLRRLGLPPCGGTALFQWLRHPEASALHEALAQRGILVRLFSDPPSLRIGLPGDAAGWARLEQALTDILQTGVRR